MCTLYQNPETQGLATVETMTPEMVKHVSANTEHHLDICHIKKNDMWNITNTICLCRHSFQSIVGTIIKIQHFESSKIFF
jgi:hypothetical protein